MKRRPAAAAAAMLLLSFVVGGLAGMVLEESLGLDWFDFLDEDNRTTDAQLLSELGLSDEQSTRIEYILDDREERLEEYWRSRVPQMRSIVAQSYQEIRDVLTPEQRETFDERVRAQGIPTPRDPD